MVSAKAAPRRACSGSSRRSIWPSDAARILMRVAPPHRSTPKKKTPRAHAWGVLLFAEQVAAPAAEFRDLRRAFERERFAAKAVHLAAIFQDAGADGHGRGHAFHELAEGFGAELPDLDFDRAAARAHAHQTRLGGHGVG